MVHLASDSQSFSIIIPSWNNLPYLKLCVQSIQEHSTRPHEIVVHVNEGTDGTLDWVRSQELKHSVSSDNVGICVAVNEAFQCSTRDVIVYMNDDMYVCPGWDEVLFQEMRDLENSGFDRYLLSSTMIEPFSTSNPCVIVQDFGLSVENFEKENLLANFKSLEKSDWQGSTWPPCLVSRKLWEEVGGFSEEFSPGAYSDPDFVMKLWERGCRVFKGIGRSRVYHFGSKSTGRVKINDGRKQFLKKWGILPSCFTKYYLRRGESYQGPLESPKISVSFAFKLLYSKCLKYLTAT